MRVLIGVGAPVRTMCRESTRRWSAATTRRPGSSPPTTETSVAAPPSAATLLAALPAPPGTISVESYSRMSTGASRETRATRP